MEQSLVHTSIDFSCLQKWEGIFLLYQAGSTVRQDWDGPHTMNAS